MSLELRRLPFRYSEPSTVDYGESALVLEPTPSPLPDYARLKVRVLGEPLESAPGVLEPGIRGTACCGPMCERCTMIKCAHVPPTLPGNLQELRVRLSGVTLTPDASQLFVTPEATKGPVLVLEKQDPDESLDSILARLTARIGPQDPPLIVHIFDVQEAPAGPYAALQDKLVVIPLNAPAT